MILFFDESSLTLQQEVKYKHGDEFSSEVLLLNLERIRICLTTLDYCHPPPTKRLH